MAEQLVIANYRLFKQFILDRASLKIELGSEDLERSLPFLELGMVSITTLNDKETRKRKNNFVRYLMDTQCEEFTPCFGIVLQDYQFHQKVGSSWYPFSRTPCPLDVKPVASVDLAAQQTGLLVIALEKLVPLAFSR